jgi:Icc-related predicted phosphoesterase
MTLRIVALSDTHEQHAKVIVPDGDVLIHAGDWTYQGAIPAVANFAHWLRGLPHRYKVVIAGNHELSLETPARDIVINLIKEAGAIYLENSRCEIEGFKIYGSPISPRFNDWAFNRNRGEQIAREWANIDPSTNILITHSPPYGILDITPRNGHQGCKDLLARIKQLKELKANIFGHLHSDTNHNVEEHFGVKFINASVLNNQYKMFNSPVVIDL